MKGSSLCVLSTSQSLNRALDRPPRMPGLQGPRRSRRIVMPVIRPASPAYAGDRDRHFGAERMDYTRTPWWSRGSSSPWTTAMLASSLRTLLRQ